MRIGICRRGAAPLVGPRGGLFAKCQPRFFGLFDVVGIDRLRLHRGIDRGAALGAADFNRALKVARMKRPPRILRSDVLRKRLAVPAVEARPALLQRGSVVDVGAVGVRKFRPFLRHVSSPPTNFTSNPGSTDRATRAPALAETARSATAPGTRRGRD